MSISAELRAGTVDRRQACFLPVASVGGGPIVGAADTIAKGLVIATGHTCWVRTLLSDLAVACPTGGEEGMLMVSVRRRATAG